MADTIAANKKPLMISTLKPKNLGNPKVAAGFSDEEMGQGKIHWLGNIIGKVSGVKRGKMPGDDTEFFYKLAGMFEGVPDDKTKPAVRSGLCFLPGGVHEMVVAMIEEAKGAIINLNLRVGTKRSTNAAGYEYVTDTIVDPSTADPLADLRGAMPQIADQRPAPEVEAAGKEKTPAAKSKGK